MTLEDAGQIVATTFVSVVSAGGAILALSKWLGQLWATRILQDERAAHEKALQGLQASTAAAIEAVATGVA
jgi:hypothetical protein